ncbi:protein Smaug [Hyposmocoma kahamanoa]|uniref:protein Smaug n=1 Tax=Hyposmocoma kahamanoa TaxID=1477025 RepID=UPI000E6D5E96|nr:protein Smaug [Hyposmocoma kahamanoa]
MNGTGSAGSASTFYEQLGGVVGVFDQCGACERTVMAVALARRVPWPGLRLLQRAVDAALQLHVEDERLERDANDEVLLAGLLSPRLDDDDDDGTERLRQLLTLLPLLRTDNERAKDVYVSAVPVLVQRCVDAPRRMSAAPDLCRQLLSYLLVHPALTIHDQRILTQWLRYLENHICGNRNTETVWQQRIDPGLLPDNIWSTNSSTFRRTIGKNVEFRGIDSLDTSYSTELQESFSKNGRDVEISLDGEKLNFDAAIAQPKSQRSNSLTPPTTNFMQMSSSAENLTDEAFVQKPRSFSLSSEHSLSQIRPISIMYGTTGSETRLDDLRTNKFGEHPGMSTVAQWLKSLRLHKYVWLFTNISYEQMMAMDEKYLEKSGVTKGARHKILVSIKKLGEREAAVAAAQAELAKAPGAGLKRVVRALECLRAVLLSPLPPHGALPAATVQALDLASKCLTGGAAGAGGARVPPPQPPAAAAPDDAEPLPPVDPLSLHCWLVERALHHEAFARPELQAALRRLRHRLPPRQFFHHVCDMPLARRPLKPKWRPGPPLPLRPKRAWAPPGCRGKSHSYPPFPAGARLPQPHPPPPPDDYSGLDALCLQMTEHAID